MSSPAGAFDLPQRISLSTQAASAMRKAIREGAWRESLPSERRLCEMLRISRPTVRTALRLLANKGLISIRQGRRNQLLQGGAVRPAAESRLVVLVSPEPLWHASVTAIQGISEMRTHLAAHGFTTEVMLCAPGRARKEQRKVETFLRQNRVFCCILLSVSKDLQEWFAARSIPALVLGSCHPSVRLPSLDVDYRAVCRHAVGVLRGKGHERLAFVVPNSRVAGDLASEAGFREGCHATAGSPAARSIVVRHDGGAKDLTGKLSALFASAQPPTALLVAKPQHVLIVLIDLLRRGISVPERVSLIARDYDSLFEIVLPSIAHYSFREEAYAHRLARLMQQMIGTGGLPAERNLIFPKYFSGGSVGAAAAI